jgi:hypothetical protein
MAVRIIEYRVIKEPVEEATKVIEKLDDSTAEVTKSSEKLTEVNSGLSDQLKVTANRFQIAGVGAGDFAAGLGKSAKSASTATKSTKLLGMALKALPILAIIGALTSLVAYFTKTEAGAQKLRVIMGFLGGALGAITDVAVNLGEKIFNAFASPKQALQDLADNVKYYFTEFIPQAVQKTLDGLGLLGSAIVKLFEGDFSGALETAKEGASQLAEGLTDLNPVTAVIKEITSGMIELGKEIGRDAVAMADLEGRLNKLKAAERDLSVERAKANAEIEAQKLIAEDVTKSIEERMAAAQAAFKIEKDLLDKEIAAKKEAVNIIKEKNELSATSEEDLQALAQAEIDLATVQQASGTKQIELNNKINSLRTEELNLIKAKQDAEKAQLEEIEAVKEAAWQKDNEREARQRAMADQKVADDKKTQEELVANRENTALSIGALINKQNAVEKALAIKKIAMDIPQMASAAFKAMVGIPVVGPILAPIAAGAAVAFGVKQMAQLSGLSLPKFADGVIGLQGGQAGKDSIPALLMPGESVMTTKETGQYRPTLEAMRSGFDPELLNSFVRGTDIHNNLIEVPRDHISIDMGGLSIYQQRGNTRIAKKQSKYRTT